MASIQGRALAELEERYEIRNAREVFRYLAEYPELEAVLIDVHSQIRKLFGHDAQAVLDFWRNVEEESDMSLWVNIVSELPNEEAGKQIDLLDEWFIDIIPRSKGSLNFDTKRR
jgi:hypothetical protein